MNLEPPPVALASGRHLLPLFAGALAVAAVGAAGLWANTQRRRVSEPRYTAEIHDGDFEVRRYAPRVVAETELSGSHEQASSEGFRRIAGYIFGGNQKRQSIAMTTPVSMRSAGERIAMTAPVSQRGSGDRWTVAFTMPAEYTLARLPIPNDARVVLRELPEQRFAVVRFANSTGEAAVRERTEALVRWATERGLRISGGAELNRYDPPWTLGFMRRNELWFAIEG
jgi:hypothetical protein